MSCISSGEGILVILSAKPERATVRMYGIFGIVGRNTRVPADMPERATRSLAQRGPDDSGTVTLHDAGREGVEIGLGNRRLRFWIGLPSCTNPRRRRTSTLDPRTGPRRACDRTGEARRSGERGVLFATNPELAREMGRNGREYIVRKFSPKPDRGEIHLAA
jgi:hypothetical protein